ncbi:UDP-glucose--hexose-1-phosphate uridylyltransferase, partial [Lactobacillus sp. XV13L]|nr:UDP-glucose--hexose-1-phosphate uridylyltransferase [Lactobacillus sp. XV13L]
KFLLGQPSVVAPIHLAWARAIKAKNQVTPANVDQVLQGELGQVFARVLEDAGVFKQTDAGRAAFMRFAQEAGVV